MSRFEVLLPSGSRFESAVAGAGADTVGRVDSMATGLPFVTPILTAYIFDYSAMLY